MFELNSFLNMDCMEGMKQLPDKYFNLAVVDPPYGIDVTKMRMGNRDIKKIDTSKAWDMHVPDEKYFNELFCVSKNQIIWGGNYFTELSATRCFLIWDKGESMYSRSFSECEYAWTSFDENAKIRKIHPNQKDRIHPTQKPVALYKWILNNYAKKGDKILDTHVGSASSLVACRELGFDYIGFELDPDYYKAASERLSVAKDQMNIFDY